MALHPLLMGSIPHPQSLLLYSYFHLSPTHYLFHNFLHIYDSSMYSHPLEMRGLPHPQLLVLYLYFHLSPTHYLNLNLLRI
nr:hypothetical protein GGBNIMDK_00019 [Bacillus cereus]WLE91180.1 hypothetical protein GGBNIMDK_00211 [Bacillus cereus]